MQIVIPMSGFGERFRSAGYVTPKPLIEVDGKPVIEYVVGMFPGEKNFLFICNQEHLDTPKYHMEETLQRIAPDGVVVGITPHKLGPVHAVLQARQHLKLSQPIIINYCDFTCDWDYLDFKTFIEESESDGCIPCYRGFHPHTTWNNKYAYVRNKNFVGLDIQEKQPFTDNPRAEYVSSGTYYFRSTKLFEKYAQKLIEADLRVDGEFYVSMIYKPMFKDGCKVLIYELQHFMQWGTPADLEEYLYWSGAFRRLTDRKASINQAGILLMPMAGLGARFVEEGYQTPKPLVEVSGLPMAESALRDLPKTEQQIFVMREDLQDRENLTHALSKASSNPHFIILDSPTDGQASTCIEGAKSVPGETCLTISACDNGMLYDGAKYERLICDSEVDIIVWGVIGYPGAIRSPEMYGWIDWDESNGKIYKVSVKAPLKDPRTDPVVVGTFTFKKAAYFAAATARMKSRDGRVGGEYYVDSAINDALALGLNCVLFPVDYYLCWGTPNDLRTFQYWQECFDSWEKHPYTIVHPS